MYKTILDITTYKCHYEVMETKKYTIEELCDLTGYSRRTIRYYVQSGIIDPPAGRGRVVEDKAPTTCRQGVWVRYEVAPGVEIHVNKERVTTDGRRIMELIRAARAIMKEEDHYE